ncbi:hypothetical protein OCD85_23195 [Bacillus pacificus]|uniref:Uncharacterized protein n=1 Tax=Bacillus cereus TaxID=1396 RepID=A0A9X0MER0_BACCE|nr:MULTISPECIES: hypothetical protein [Bacillus cereus group]EMA6344113.1 hypothetical protein [Bacillus cytotoxicus]KXY36151.1 hypothetical protein AT268_34285 [Bacillus cereus]MCU5363854.1 hypothetical protein [Bacillus pacificus]MCU5401281.1 hypothetical protein [Bacillus pacificus]MDA1886882.1 hypothetical protein [Bacillus cereus group sp. BY105LC]
MYFSKLPIGFFDLNTDTETLHSLLYEHFNKTIKKGTEIQFQDYENQSYFFVPSPVFTEELMGNISGIDLIIYAYLCKDAYLNKTGKVKVDIPTISKETAIKKTVIRNSINSLNRVDLIVKDSKDTYYVIEELFYYFTDNEFKEFVEVVNNSIPY